MDRRTFIGSITLSVVAAKLAQAQQAGKKYKIGYLALGPHPKEGALPVSLRQALLELGYVEGKNVTYLGRWADARRERLPSLATELVALEVDVIVTLGSLAAVASRQASSTIPIVMATAGDPVGVGLIQSLSHPGGNVTGVSDNATEISPKRLEILKEVVPTASHIAVLWNSQDQAMTLRYRAIDRSPERWAYRSSRSPFSNRRTSTMRSRRWSETALMRYSW
jgi:putative ABC transport system substrate-binding protein